MLDSFLNRQNKSSSEEANRVKYIHLMNQNGNLHKTIEELKRQLASLRHINIQLQQNTQNSSHAIINQLSQQNYNLEQNMLRLIAYNEELSCDILMKNQLICENQNQSRQVIANYEEKIYELRMSLQNKELTVKNMQQRSTEQKQELFGSTTRINFMYFNEMNQLKILMDQYNIENAQLKYLNSLKQEQINRITNQLNCCERFLKKSHEWHAHKQSLNQNSEMSRTTKDKKSQYKLKLCEQLTRYDQNIKNLSNPNNYTNNTVLNKLKSVATKFFNDNYALHNDKKKLIRNLASKDREFKILQQAYKKLDIQMRNSWVQIQFYRNNFHELTKVTKQRKIQYYQQNYRQILPILNKKQKILQKKGLINYWKAWSKAHDDSLLFDGRRVLNKKSNNRIKCRRNLSCIPKFNYFIESPIRKICRDPVIETAIINFINNSQQDHGIYNTTIEENRQNNQGDIFNDDPISMIMKPKMFEQNKNFKTAKFLDIDVDLDDE